MPSVVGIADGGVVIERGSPPPIRGVWGASTGNFENFNSIWCTLVKSGGSFMQKETTIKEKVSCGAAV